MPTAPPSLRQPLRCLVIEDRPLDFDLLVAALQRSGFAPDAHRVETMAEFLAALATPPEVILSDYSLPGFTGLEALALLRKQGHDLPFILVSGTVGEEIAVEAMRLGAADYLLKDRLERLGSAVAHAIEQGRLHAEHRRALAALATSEAHLRTIIRTEPECVKLVSPEGRLLEMNPAGLAMLEASSLAELQRRPLLEFVSADYRETFVQLHQRVMSGETGTAEFETVGLRGGRRWLETHATPLRDADGRIKALLGVTRDITSRKRAEEALREAQALAKLGRWSWDIAEDRLEWSDDSGLIADPPSAPTSLTYMDCLQILHPYDRARTQDAVQAALASRAPLDIEIRLLSADGRVHHAHVRGRVQVDGAGRPLRLHGYAQDITEQRKLEDQFLRAQRMENLGLLAAGIAHDLNNILAPIMMMGPLLRSRLPGESDQRLLTTLEQSARRGAALVKQILTFAHGSGNELGPVPLRHIARDICSMIEETFPRHLRFSADIAADLWPAHANASQIHQVLLNLCINARDAMPAGGQLSLRVVNCPLDAAAAASIRDARPGRYVLLEVTDTGCGIPPELQERVWEPFFTTKGEDKGTGLGLSTIRGIVTRHQGFAAMESAVGRGTTFRIYLPAGPDATAPAEGTTMPFAGIKANGETILIVDDESDVRSFISTILHQHGYQTLTARDGNEALDQFRKHQDRIQLVITDRQMRGLEVPQLVAALREAQPSLPILLCTGSPDHSIPGIARENVLLKPFETGRLLSAVRRLLETR